MMACSIVFLLLPQICCASLSVTLKFVRYEDVGQGRLANGLCCTQFFIQCVVPCDPSIRVCASSHTTPGNCDIYQGETKPLGHLKTVTFGSEMGAVPNPLKLSVGRWETLRTDEDTRTASALTLSTSTRTPYASTRTPSASTRIPSASSGTPTASTGTLSASTRSTSASTVTSSASTVTPSASTRTPSASTGTPTASTGTPSASTRIPSASTGSPTASTGTPSASTVTPSASTRTLSASTVTPSASTGTLSASTRTPSASIGPPIASTGLPTASAGTPIAFTSTPSTSTESPTDSMGSPTVVFNIRSAIQSISSDDSLPDLDNVPSEGGEVEFGDEDQHGDTMYSCVDLSEECDLPVLNIPRRSNRNLLHTQSDHPLCLQPSPLRLEAVRPSESLHEILTRLASVIKKERRNIVNVTRSNVVSGGIRAFNRPSFNPENGLCVRFAGEYAIDDGGPSREFLRLLMKEISSLPIFTGDDTKKMLDLNYTAVRSGLYLTVGKMIAYSVVHSGSLPRFFSPLLFNTLVGDSQIQPKIDDIQDVAQRESLLKIRKAEDMSSFLDAVGCADQLIQLAGCYSLTLSFAKKEELCDALIHFIVIGRIKECLYQFSKGLDTLGVLAEMRLHSKEVKELFCFDEKYELSASVLEMVYSVPSLSEPGSNRRRMEEETISYWSDYLLDVAEGTESVTLRDILVFGTGAESIPPLGLHPQPQLTFHTAMELNPENRENFPRANTCANVLDIPMISNYNMFKKYMNAAISVKIFTSE